VAWGIFSPLQIVNDAALSSVTSSTTNVVGDYQSFVQIEQKALDFVKAGDFKSAKASADDLEYSWDQAAAICEQ
jgi:hypothetical protein